VRSTMSTNLLELSLVDRESPEPTGLAGAH